MNILMLILLCLGILICIVMLIKEVKKIIQTAHNRGKHKKELSNVVSQFKVLK